MGLLEFIDCNGGFELAYVIKTVIVRLGQLMGKEWEKANCRDIVPIKTTHTSSVAGYILRSRRRYYTLWVCAVCTEDKGFGVFSVVGFQ